MYVLATRVCPLPVISLQTGQTVAKTSRVVVDPSALELIGIMCETTQKRRSLVIMTRDIREFALDCVIIDTEDELADPSDIVRLSSLLDHPFNLLGKAVVSELGRKVGVVEDYTLNADSYRVQKLYVRQSLLHSIFGSSLIIDRVQIVDVSPQRIVVRDATLKAGIVTRNSGQPTIE